MNRATTRREHCDCGTLIEPCVTCSSPRCTSCDPYVTDDCVVALASAS